MSLTRAELDRAGCAAPNCGHDHSVLYLHPLCHPKGPVDVRYEKATGQIVVICNRCKSEVARVEVASSSGKRT